MNLSHGLINMLFHLLTLVLTRLPWMLSLWNCSYLWHLKTASHLLLLESCVCQYASTLVPLVTLLTTSGSFSGSVIASVFLWLLKAGYILTSTISLRKWALALFGLIRSPYCWCPLGPVLSSLLFTVFTSPISGIANALKFSYSSTLMIQCYIIRCSVP